MSHYTGANALLAEVNAAGAVFQVIGLPCPQFANQEPGNDGEILPTLKYVRPGGGYVPAFPLTLITNVNGGTGVHPAISLIKAACPLGPTDTVASGGSPLWDPISVGDLQW